MTRALFLLPCVLLLLLPAAARASLPAACAPSPASACCSIPFDGAGGEIMLRVMLNGRGPFSFKLDTGSTISLVTPAVAKAAGIETLGRTELCGAYGSDVSLGSGTIACLDVGGVALYVQPCLIGTLNNAVRCDGILAGDIFDDYAVQIDFAASAIRLIPSGVYQPGRADLSIPFELGGNHVPVCDGSLDGIPVRLEIDTGFDGSVALLPGFVRANRLAETHRKVATVTTYSLGGIRPVGLYAMRGLSLGGGAGVRLQDRVLTLFDDFDSPPDLFDCDGLLGAQMLAHWTVTFDYAHSRIVLR